MHSRLANPFNRPTLIAQKHQTSRDRHRQSKIISSNDVQRGNNRIKIKSCYHSGQSQSETRNQYFPTEHKYFPATTSSYVLNPAEYNEAYSEYYTPQKGAHKTTFYCQAEGLKDTNCPSLLKESTMKTMNSARNLYKSSSSFSSNSDPFSTKNYLLNSNHEISSELSTKSHSARPEISYELCESIVEKYIIPDDHDDEQYPESFFNPRILVGK